MANYTKFYTLPDGKTLTRSIDEHIQAWRDVAAPIEKALDVKLSGFDPVFSFTRTDPASGIQTSVTLPTWFARALSEKLKT